MLLARTLVVAAVLALVDIVLGVGITNADARLEVETLAEEWDGVKQVTTLNSAYSTMAWQKDNRLGLLYEEETYGKSNYAYGGYTIVYECFDIEDITEGKYKYRK